MRRLWTFHLVTLALAACTPALSSATLTTRYTYEPNIANVKLGTKVTAAGDLNGDGFGDIAASAVGGAYVFYGSSSGPFVSTPWVGTGYGSTPAAVGDVNGDGYQDLVTFDPSTPSAAGHVYLFAGSSSGLGSSPITTLVGPADSSGWGLVAGVGDVNGDGYADVIIAAPDYDDGGQVYGRLWLYRGNSSGLSLDTGFEFPRSTEKADLRHVGYAVCGVGDRNGDGFADVAVLANRPGSADDRLIVLAGSTTGLAPNGSWSPLAGHFGELRGPADVNGDNNSDFLVAAPGPSLGNWLVYGSGSGPALITLGGEAPAFFLGDVNNDGYTDMAQLSGSYTCECGDPFCIPKPCGGYFPPKPYLFLGGSSLKNANELLGSAGKFADHYSEAGDVDGDGFTDLIEGFPSISNGQSNEGRVAVFRWTGPTTSPPTTTSKPDGGWVPGNPMCHGMPPVHLNADGLGDLVVGEPGFMGAEGPVGRVSVFLGPSTTGPPFDLFGGGNSQFGAAVDGGGDVNGDGYSDLLVGAPGLSNGQFEEGSAFLFYGGSVPDPLPDWSVEANASFAHMGTSVAVPGDVNGDGYADVLTGLAGGLPAAQGDGLPMGGAHIQLYLGSSSGPGVSPVWSVEGNSADGFGSALAGGDFNRDGYADVAIGVPGANHVLVYHGSALGLPPAPSVMLSGSGGFGSAIATAGDVNGDGYGDLLVGSPLFGDFSPTGRAELFAGSVSGLVTIAAWTADGAPGEALGSSLAAGDLDGDGLSDVVVGGPGFDSDRGEARVYVSTESGLVLKEQIAGDPGTAQRLGGSVACLDTDGDGFADVALGAPGHSGFGPPAGMQFHFGNGSSGRTHGAQQLRAIGGAPVDRMGSSGATGFRIRAQGFGPAGRSRLRLEYQVHAPGAPWGPLMHGPWQESTFPAPVPMEVMVMGLQPSTPYAWRARIASSGPDIYRSSHWLSCLGAGGSASSIRTGTVVLDVPPGNPAASGPLVAAVRPNPAVSLVHVDLLPGGPEAVALDVFDLQGRHLRHLVSDSGPAASR